MLPCSYTPHESVVAAALSALGLGLPATLLGALLACAARHACAARRAAAAAARSDGTRDRPLEVRPPLQALAEGVAAGWVCGWAVSAAACTVVGAAALCAAPLVLAGRNNAVRCAVAELLQLLAPTLVLMGVAFGRPMGGPRRSVKEDQRKDREERPGPLKRLRQSMPGWLRLCPSSDAWGALSLFIAQLAALALLVTLGVVLMQWAVIADATEQHEEEAYKDPSVGGRRVVVSVNTTHCVPHPLQGSDAQELQLVLLTLTLLVGCVRLGTARRQSLSELLAPLATMGGGAAYFLYFYTPLGPDYAVRACA